MIPALRRLKQEDHLQFEASLDYINEVRATSHFIVGKI